MIEPFLFPTGKCVGLKYFNISENLLDDLPAHILKSTLSSDFMCSTGI